MKTATVELNDKTFEVRELRVTEFLDIKNDIIDLYTEADSFNDLINKVVEKHITKFVPRLTKEDLLNSYPSELEGLVEKFIEVNFTGLRKIMAFLGISDMKDTLQALFSFVCKFVQESLKENGSQVLELLSKK